jgi:hypothetical protein
MKIKTTIKWYLHAILDFPQGIFCPICHKLNFWFDDCGFFCSIDENNNYKVRCKKCWDKVYYKYRVPRYGCGDR